MRRHLLFHEYRTAAQEAKNLLGADCSLQEVRVILQALAKHHEYVSWEEAFLRSQKRFPSLAFDRDVHEDLAATFLQENIRHSSLTVRVVTILSVGLARDYRLVPIVLQALSDDSDVVREIALQVATMYGSGSLLRAVSNLAKNDPSIQVRVAAYRAAVLLEIKDLTPYLRSVIQNTQLDGTERREAWKALCSLTHSFDDVLTGIDQALMTCEMLKEYPEKYVEEDILELFSVDHPEVQVAALQVILRGGKEIRSSSIMESVRKLACDSPSARVQMQAAAILYLQGDSYGEHKLIEALSSSSSVICETASEAICSLGIKGAQLAGQFLSTVQGMRARANLAFVLLVSREKIEEAGDVIATFMHRIEPCRAIEQFLCEDQKILAPASPLQREIMKRDLAKKIIHLLVAAQYSKVKMVVAQYLAGQQVGWSFCSGLFWEEGDGESPMEPSQEESFAAALEKALFSLQREGEEAGLNAVMSLYPCSRWQDKLTILEAIACSENRIATRFLRERCLHEAASLQSAAAGALFALFK
ncbi:membrane protein [Chlamydia muridarum]|uniref:HEAT repeat domain-containing protein n=1 Tax=Chlamydia muridarum TaxID=83560 RepID=A0A097KFG8_CHLMR|nr:hypothetical protein BB17_03540 [Chlamydia muridarum str. Nigg 2 MCR]AIT90832.1 membrane protein [Chlamydia muridarum]AIT91721.1 membrane protein [Chlamydia muridarum]AIW23599.1 membrane protein [Chlamydia muridarum]AJR10735.1 hypothetical protein BD36_03545 [Chlamydia muridarum]